MSMTMISHTASGNSLICKHDLLHLDYKAMKPYIDIAERTKADAMKAIEDAWSKWKMYKFVRL